MQNEGPLQSGKNVPLKSIENGFSWTVCKVADADADDTPHFYEIESYLSADLSNIISRLGSN